MKTISRFAHGDPKRGSRHSRLHASAMASAILLALGAIPAKAGTCTAPDQAGTAYCDGQFEQGLRYPTDDSQAMDDLALIVGANQPSNITGVADTSGAGLFFRIAETGTLENHADITLRGPDNSGNGVTGIKALGSSLDVSNAGRIEVSTTSYYGATGIHASTESTGGSVLVSNSGDIDIGGETTRAVGIYASAADGWISIVNALSGTVTTHPYYGGSIGLSATTVSGDISIVNDGQLESSGYRAVGMSAQSSNGAIAADNTGDIAIRSYEGRGYGMQLQSTGSVSASNSGTIDVWTNYLPSVGMQVLGDGTGIDVVNTGSIRSYSDQSDAIAIDVSSSSADMAIRNYGDLVIEGRGRGIRTHSADGDISIRNDGNITAHNEYRPEAAAIESATDHGDISITNAGVVSVAGDGCGIDAISIDGDISIDNQGRIGVSAALYGGSGIRVAAEDGSLDVVNRGTIEVGSDRGTAWGISTSNIHGDTVVENSGNIKVTGLGYGIEANSEDGDISMTNSGTIEVLQGTGVRIETEGTITFVNTGTVTDQSGEIVGVVLDSDSGAMMRNLSSLGTLQTGDGDDFVDNRAGATWLISDDSTDLGGGNDFITNASGGTIHLRDGAISLGSANGNRFENHGSIRVSGYGLVNMGIDGEPNAYPLVNNGAIDMIDGLSDDRLTIVGDLSGNGSLDIDVGVPSGPADQLRVDGSIESPRVR